MGRADGEAGGFGRPGGVDGEADRPRLVSPSGRPRPRGERERQRWAEAAVRSVLIFRRR